MYIERRFSFKIEVNDDQPRNDDERLIDRIWELIAQQEDLLELNMKYKGKNFTRYPRRKYPSRK